MQASLRFIHVTIAKAALQNHDVDERIDVSLVLVECPLRGAKLGLPIFQCYAFTPCNRCIPSATEAAAASSSLASDLVGRIAPPHLFLDWRLLAQADRVVLGVSEAASPTLPIVWSQLDRENKLVPCQSESNAGDLNLWNAVN